MEIKNKIAVVTGAGGGIGSALVEKLVKEEVFCILIDKHPDLPPKGTVYFQTDLTKPQEIDQLVEKITVKYRNVDFLFNVAGVGIYKKFEELSLEEWNTSLDLNLTAPFYLTKKLLFLLKKSACPFVLNVGSGMGVVPSAGRSAYCASKFGLRGLTLSLAKEYKNTRVKFCLLTLGSVMTPFGTGGIEKRKELEKKGKKYLSPEQVAQRLVEIAKSDERKAEYTIFPEGY